MNRRNFIKRGALFVPAIFIPKIIRAVPTFANPVFFRGKVAPSGGGSTPQWFNSLDPATTDASQSQSDSSFVFSTQITLSNGGSATKFRIKFGTIDFDATPIKIALYDSAGSTLFGSVTSAINIADSNTLKEFSVTSISVTATTYMLAADVSSSSSNYATKSGTTGTAVYDHPGYASFPQSTLVTPFASVATIAMGIFVS